MGGHPPGHRGRECPQIPPPAAPLTTLPPSPGPTFPSPSTHSSPPCLLHAPLHACLPLFPPWATILHKLALSQSCTLHLRFPLARPSQLSNTRCFSRTLRFRSHAPHLTPWNSACTLFPRPSLTLLTSGNLRALAADTLGTPFPSPTHRLCTHPLAHPSLCSALAHSLACAPLLTLLPPTFPSYP